MIGASTKGYDCVIIPGALKGTVAISNNVPNQVLNVAETIGSTKHDFKHK